MRRSFRTVVWTGVLAAAVLPAFGQAGDNKPLPRTQAEYQAYFARQPRYLYGCGVIWSIWLPKYDESMWAHDNRSVEMIQALGSNVVHITIPWDLVEPEPGKWSFDYVDHEVAECEKRGLAMFAYMGLTPEWALPPEAPKKPGIGFRFPPPDSRRQEFITYCRKVAERYKGRVVNYEFWNEPNGCSWVKRGCANGDQYALYTKWLKIWYATMKQVNPDCVLGAGALDYNQDIDNGYTYLEGMYREGAKDYFDAFDIHPYDKKGTLHFRAIEDTRRVMVANGDGHKGIWLGEWGWAMKNEEKKARRVTEALEALSQPKYCYVTLANYLCLTDLPDGTPYGLCDKDFKPRPAYTAFKDFALAHKPATTATTRPSAGK
jgi:polysaccharide biosynthesis protein PslG